MTGITEKERVRAMFLDQGPGQPQTGNWGRMAELLRKDEVYRRAGTIFVTPAHCLHQVRINSLLDNKRLLMPTPSLKNGFVLLRPGTIPFPKLGFSVTPKGMDQFGEYLGLEKLDSLNIGLLLTDAVAVDQRGNRLGNGKGFFDLAGAILAEAGGLARDAAFLAMATTGTALLPIDPWDIPLTGILDIDGIHRFPQQKKSRPRIFWDRLSMDRIRKITPLRQLHQRRA
ncbi:MAG: 5-formyltetrahydrofolate cyclo-ligase [Desulfobacterales bacterium]|nr:5-formyltetrahydrofolate cyclo-ligase [Desulfobacterales bacterium]